jgi:hypothetical protein
MKKISCAALIFFFIFLFQICISEAVWAPGSNVITNNFSDSKRSSFSLALSQPIKWEIEQPIFFGTSKLTLFEMNTYGGWDVGYEYNFDWNMGEGIDVGDDGWSYPELITRADMDIGAKAWLNLTSPGLYIDVWGVSPLNLNLLELLTGVNPNISEEISIPSSGPIEFTLPFLSDNSPLVKLDFKSGIYDGDYSKTTYIDLGSKLPIATAKIGVARGFEGDLSFGLNSIEYYTGPSKTGSQISVYKGVDVNSYAGTTLRVDKREYIFRVEPSFGAGIALYAEFGIEVFLIGTYYLPPVYYPLKESVPPHLLSAKFITGFDIPPIPLSLTTYYPIPPLQGTSLPKNVITTPPPPTTPYDNATFVADVTIPDGTLMSSGQSFTKTWRLRNTGTTTWGSGHKLTFVSQTGSYQMGGPSSVSVSSTVSPENTVDILVNLTAPSAAGTYYGYWQMKNPNGNWFGDKIWVKIVVNTGTPSFNVGDFVRVTGTGGIGLKVRLCPSTNDTSCPKKCTASDGGTGLIIGGPETKDGYTWWQIKWDYGSGNCPNGETGWSAQNWLEKVSYPSEGDLIRAKGTIFIYLYKNGKKWWIKNDDIFSKMGYTQSNIRDLPWGMINDIPYGSIIVDNGTLIRQQGDTKIYLIQNNQRRLFTSNEAFIKNGYKQEDVIDVTPAVMSMYPQGPDITTEPKVLVVSPNGGEKLVVGN